VSRRAAEFDRHVRDHHAMLVPQLVNLLLARIEKIVEVVDKQDAFARRLGCAVAAEENVESALRFVKHVGELMLRDDLEARHPR
jgi:hypothetical protein